jgi:hypothetical protein
MSVKLMLSGVLAASYTGIVARRDICAPFSITFRKKRLDKTPPYVVIIFTAGTQPNRKNENAAGEKQLRQAEGITATRNTQPPPSGCAPSFVREQRILRSQGLAAGEIRDGTTGPCGQAGGFPNGQGVWILPPVALPSGIYLRARWVIRITSPEAWSEKRSQAHSGSDEIRGRTANPGAIPEFRSAGRAGAAQVPGKSAPPQHRAAASAGKKTSISLQPAYPAAPLEKDGLIAAYEELRRQILNGQRGPGLALFMRRGMREWMTACSLCLAPSPTKEFTAAPDQAVLPQGVRTEVVLILAGMLLHGCQERVS